MQALLTNPNVITPGATKLKNTTLDQFLGVLAFGADFCALNAAFIMAYFLRFHTGDLGSEVLEISLPLPIYLPLQVIIICSCLGIFCGTGIYQQIHRSSFFHQVSVLITTMLSSIAASLIFAYLFNLHYSRLVLLYTLFFTIGFLLANRVALYILRAICWGAGIGIQNILLVQTGNTGRQVLCTLTSQCGPGHRVVGFVRAEEEEAPQEIKRFKQLGTFGDLPGLLADYELDSVLIALPLSSHQRISETIQLCLSYEIPFQIVPDLFDTGLTNVHVSAKWGIPLLQVRTRTINRVALLVKRLLDLTLSALALLILLPAFLLIALAIKLDSPGPVIYIQERVGKGGRPFRFYKFRSMRHKADTELQALLQANEFCGPHFKMRHDPRITQLGKWLRRYSIDELPQLFNILIGNMSLVGPRPAIVYEVKDYNSWHRRRLDFTPGLTGLWQVSGRSNISFEEMVLLDIYYIENWSLIQDLRILCKTLSAVLTTEGAH